MKLSREEKRARLEAKAGKEIDEYLDWEGQHPKPNLTEMEDVILKLRKELGKEMAQMILEEQAAECVNGLRQSFLEFSVAFLCIE